MRKILTCLLLIALTSSLSWANADPDPQHVETIRKKVADCLNRQRRVVVETYDNRRLQGYVSEAGPDDFVLGYEGRLTTLSYGDVKKIKWQSAVTKQVKVVIAAAAITAAIFGLVVLLGGLKG